MLFWLLGPANGGGLASPARKTVNDKEQLLFDLFSKKQEDYIAESRISLYSSLVAFRSVDKKNTTVHKRKWENKPCLLQEGKGNI